MIARRWTKLNSPSVTLEQAVAIARRFEVVVVNRGVLEPYMEAMREANPDIKIVVYRNGTASRSGQAFAEDLYSHDSFGRRITLPDSGLLMNPANSTWRTWVAIECEDRITAGGYDGCYVDVLGIAPLSGNYSSAVPVNPRTKKPWSPAQWLSRTSLIGEGVKERLVDEGVGSYVVVNGLQNGRRYADLAAPSSVLLGEGIDGANAEDFIRLANSPLDDPRSEKGWRADLDMLADAEGTGHSVFAMTKVWVPATPAQVHAAHEYALASFLLGANGRSLFTFFSGTERMSVEEVSAPSLFDIDLGAAEGQAAQAGPVFGTWWYRKFEGGMVVVNPTSAPNSCHLADPYVRIGTDEPSNETSALDLGPKSGAILLTP